MKTEVINSAMEENFREKLKQLREQSGLRQEQIAKYLGVTQTFISKVESGERNYTVDQAEKLAGLYGCTLHDLESSDADLHPIHTAFRAQELTQDDIRLIAVINQIAANSRWMEELLREAGNG